MNFNLDTATNYIKSIPDKFTLENAQELANNALESYADSIVETPDYAKFMRVVENQDLARTNTFVVRFEDFRSTINSDGILGMAEGIIPDGVKGAFGGITGGISKAIGGNNWSRIQDIAYNQSQKFLTPKIKSIMGAYDPSLVRLIPGAGEFIDMFTGAGYDVNKDLALMVKSVNLPGTAFETQVNKTDRKPFHEVRGRTYDNIRMTLYCTPGYAERIWFLAWMNSIQNPKRGTYGFYSKYAKNIDVVTLDRKSIKTSVVHCDGCFPIRVGEIQLDFDQGNQVATFEVEFAISTMTHLESKGSQNFVAGAESIFHRVKGAIGALR